MQSFLGCPPSWRLRGSWGYISVIALQSCVFPSPATVPHSCSVEQIFEARVGWGSKNMSTLKCDLPATSYLYLNSHQWVGRERSPSEFSLPVLSGLPETLLMLSGIFECRGR